MNKIIKYISKNLAISEVKIDLINENGEFVGKLRIDASSDEYKKKLVVCRISDLLWIVHLIEGEPHYLFI